MEAMRRLLCSNCHKELELTSQEALEGRMEIDQPTETRTLNLFGEGDVAKHKALDAVPERLFHHHRRRVRNKTKKVTEKVPKKVPKKVTNEVEGENGASKRHNGNANDTTFLISLDRSNILENASQEASFGQSNTSSVPELQILILISLVWRNIKLKVAYMSVELESEGAAVQLIHCIIKGSLRSKSTGRAPELLLDYPIDASWLAVTWMYCGGSIAGIALVPLRSTILFCYFFALIFLPEVVSE
ncbi:hypothetical protein AAG906_014373 [Vitis piasezkii]